jgi:hypothetical protein
MEAGASVGESTGTRKEKSYLENDRIRKQVNHLLHLRRTSYISKNDVDNFVKEFEIAEMESDADVFVYKDPRLVYFYKILERSLGPEWLIIRRNENDTATSCKNTGYMHGYSSKEEWKSWVHSFNCKLDSLSGYVLKSKEVRPTKIVNGDFDEAIDLINDLGLNTGIDLNKRIGNSIWRI